MPFWLKGPDINSPARSHPIFEGTGMSWLALAVEDVLIHLVHNRPSDISSNLFKNERKLLIGGW